MITTENSIPLKSENYRLGEDIFFVQFNDISFYIEDEDQENFFHCILRNLFPKIKIEKIFPLCGKDNVITQSELNLGDKTKVFIVDKDFDDIFNNIKIYPNLFYIERYSIENFLLEEKAIIDYIISEKPKLKRHEIQQQFSLINIIDRIIKPLKDLTYLHLVVQNKCPIIKNISLNHERFIKFSINEFTLIEAQINSYKISIQQELSKLDKRLTLKSQLRKIKQIVHMHTREICIKHIPGKFIIKMLKQIIESMFGLTSRNTESFCYRIAEKCNFESLLKLQIDISNYIN